MIFLVTPMHEVYVVCFKHIIHHRKYQTRNARIERLHFLLCVHLNSSYTISHLLLIVHFTNPKGMSITFI